jgi:hypothetical protein
MIRLPWLNALLLAAAAALGALAYFGPKGDTQDEHPLSALKASEVTSITIERVGAPGIAVEKKNGHWLITTPLAARANEHRVRQLLEIVEARSANRFAAADLQRFELERPAVRVTIGGQSFDIGMVNALTREQYVLTGNAVYTVHPRYGVALPADLYDLASRQLLGPGELPQRIELKEFAVEQRGGKWTLTPAGTGNLSQDELARWVDGWRSASALRVEAHVGGKPRHDIRVRLKNGSEVTFGILSSGANLVLTRPDEKLQYHFRIETAKRLLAPPAAVEVPAAKR